MRIVGKGETVQIMEALSVTHMDAEWVFYYELRTNSGAMGAGQWMDAYALSRYGGKNHRSIGYEIKVTRADFLSEMRKETKQDAARKLCTQFYYVVPSLSVCKPEEVPEWAGLLLWDGSLHSDNKDWSLYQRFQQLKVAPKLPRGDCPWEFAAALAYSKTSPANGEALQQDDHFRLRTIMKAIEERREDSLLIEESVA